MTATIRRLMLLTDVRRARLALAALLGVADDPLRSRPDGDGRLPDLEGGRAPGRALADRGHRRRPLLRARAARWPATSSGSPRTTSRCARSAARARRCTRRSSRSRLPSSRTPGAATCSSRFVGDVDSLQNLYLRGLEPPLVALIAGAASVVRRRSSSSRPPGSCSQSGCSSAGSLCPCRALRVAAVVGPARAAPRRAHGRARRDAGRERASSRPRPRAGPHRARCAGPTRGSSASRAAPPSPTASATASASSSTGATVVGVLAVAVQAHADGTARPRR